MRNFLHHSRVLGTVVVIASAAGACAPSSITEIGNVKLVPGIENIARPDWLTYSGGKNEFTLRPVTPADLVTGDGQCAGADAAPADADGQGPQTPGGIALQMTECDVVRRAGPPEQLQIGNEGGQRTVVITYSRGARPGIYRFAGGRLNAIERAPGAPAERPQKGKAAKKKAASG